MTEDDVGHERNIASVALGNDHLYSLRVRCLFGDQTPGKSKCSVVLLEYGVCARQIASTLFWPCETRTSTCRNFATISSGLDRFPCHYSPPCCQKTYLKSDHFNGGGSAFEDTVVVGRKNLPRALAARGQFYLDTFRRVQLFIAGLVLGARLVARFVEQNYRFTASMVDVDHQAIFGLFLLMVVVFISMLLIHALGLCVPIERRKRAR